MKVGLITATEPPRGLGDPEERLSRQVKLDVVCVCVDSGTEAKAGGTSAERRSASSANVALLDGNFLIPGLFGRITSLAPSLVIEARTKDRSVSLKGSARRSTEIQERKPGLRTLSLLDLRCLQPVQVRLYNVMSCVPQVGQVFQSERVGVGESGRGTEGQLLLAPPRLVDALLVQVK